MSTKNKYTSDFKKIIVGSIICVPFWICLQEKSLHARMH